MRSIIEDIREKLDSNSLTEEEIVKYTINLAKENNIKTNSFVTIIDDAKRKYDNESILKGIPYAAKDLFSTKGVLTTGSSNALKDYVPFFDATVIQKLDQAGTILIGKTTCDEFGLGGTGTTCHTGPTLNPFDSKRQAGGSSCGSAAAVASGSVPFALGTDTGDSVRKPAAYCGIVGFKPSYGLISRYGVLPFASSLDTVGVMTKTVKDAAIVTDIIKGEDKKDMTVVPFDGNLTLNIDKDIKGKKLFYIKEICNAEYYENPDDELIETINTFHKTIKKAKENGFIVEEVSIDKKILNAIFPSYQVITCAEATSNLSMYTGIIYGPRGAGENVNSMIKDYRTSAFSSLIKRRLVIGSYVLQKENQGRYYLNACKVRILITNMFNELFKEYDGCITIASGGPAPLLEEKGVVLTNKTVLENHLAIGNFGGFPSITIPNGYVSDMPIGINITGKIFDDRNILNIAYKLEEIIDFDNIVKEEK